MNKRIRMLREELKLSQKDFAKKIGLSQNTISQMENGSTTITEATIIIICLQFCVNETWLRTGEGPMFHEHSRQKKQLMEMYDELNPIVQNYIFCIARDLLRAQRELAAEQQQHEQEPLEPEG